jgi:aminoglycoside 3-N-acetyltransferase
MISYRDIVVGLEKLGLDRSTPVLAHVAPARLGKIHGGLETLLGAILGTIDNVMMPSFTYATMVVPQVGPPDNFIDYGSNQAGNLNASIFNLDLLSDMPGAEVSELLRKYPGTYRSAHPILSFTGLGLDVALIDQTPEDPYAPIRKLMELKGWVALIGAEPSENFSLHYAEFLGGRKQFVRWALTEKGIKECPHFPAAPMVFIRSITICRMNCTK